MNLQEARDIVDEALLQHQHAKRTLTKERQELKDINQKLKDIAEAQQIIQQTTQQIQNKVHQQVAEVVTRCLSAVFEDPYTFKILFEQRRGKTEARIVFERDGYIIDPMTASGLGVVDVAAFALRLSALLLSRPPLRRVLLLDEPFKFVSEDNMERVGELLQKLAEELKVQFVIVTHNPKLHIGTVYRTSKRGVPIKNIASAGDLGEERVKHHPITRKASTGDARRRSGDK
jgi:hypothetical protein